MITARQQPLTKRPAQAPEKGAEKAPAQGAYNALSARPETSPAEAPDGLDVAAMLAPIGLGPADADALAQIAEDAIAEMDKGAREKLYRESSKRMGRVRNMSRACVAASFVLAYSRSQTAKAAAVAIGKDLRGDWYEIMAGMYDVPILRAVWLRLQDARDNRLATLARDAVEHGVTGGEITRSQERLAPFLLERLDRERFASDRGGPRTSAPAAAAQVVINIADDSAYKSCCKVLQSGDGSVINA